MDSSDRSTWAEVAAGGGLGILVGVLVGLSATGVVGGVVAALTAVLATFLGLNKPGATSDSPPLPRARIASFGVVGAAAVMLGIAVRAHNWFGNNVAYDVRQWTSVGATPTDAIDLVAWQRLGVVPRTRQVAGAPPKSTAADSVLFSAAANKCSSLLGDRFDTTQHWLDAMNNAGPDWRRMAQAAAAAPAQNQPALLDAAYKLVCGS